MSFRTSNPKDLLYMDLLTRIEKSFKNGRSFIVDFIHYGISWLNIRMSVQNIAKRLNISFEFHYCKEGNKPTKYRGEIIPIMS